MKQILTSTRSFLVGVNEDESKQDTAVHAFRALLCGRRMAWKISSLQKGRNLVFADSAGVVKTFTPVEKQIVAQDVTGQEIHFFWVLYGALKGGRIGGYGLTNSYIRSKPLKQFEKDLNN